jgi:DNA-binding response OmpR family regulator
MAVVLLSGDLMSASRIEGAARLAGASYRQVGTVDAAVEACEVNPAALVLVDLTTRGLDVASLVGRTKELADAKPTIIAYGPHVHEAVLAAAEAAGCDQVLSRGQFMSRVDALIAAHKRQIR